MLLNPDDISVFVENILNPRCFKRIIILPLLCKKQAMEFFSGFSASDDVDRLLIG